jgi:hypothetical protein
MIKWSREPLLLTVPPEEAVCSEGSASEQHLDFTTDEGVAPWYQTLLPPT